MTSFKWSKISREIGTSSGDCLVILIGIANTISWWRHQIKTFSALLAFCAENSPVPGEFSAQRPVTRSFDVFFHLHLNKPLSKQSQGWWFAMTSGSLWRQCNDGVMCASLAAYRVCCLHCCLHYPFVLFSGMSARHVCKAVVRLNIIGNHSPIRLFYVNYCVFKSVSKYLPWLQSCSGPVLIRHRIWSSLCPQMCISRCKAELQSYLLTNL